MLNFPLMWNSFPLNIYRFINATWFAQLHLSIKIFSRRLLNSLTHLENYFLLLFNDSESIIDDFYISGHVIFFRIHIIHSSSFNIAIYTYICEYWCKISSHHYSHYSHKNSSWNLMIAPFKTIFISSKIRSALGIMFWYLKNNLFLSSIASFIEILVYKLEKYTGNKKQPLFIKFWYFQYSDEA